MSTISQRSPLGRVIRKGRPEKHIKRQIGNRLSVPFLVFLGSTDLAGEPQVL